MLKTPKSKRSLGLVGLGWIEIEPAPGDSGGQANGKAASTLRPDATEAAPTLRHLIGTVPLIARSASVPGASVLGLPAAMQAARQATARPTPVSSVPVTFGSGPEARPGVVLMQGLSSSAKSALASVAFAVLSPEALIVPITASRGDAMRACLFDARPYRAVAARRGVRLRVDAAWRARRESSEFPKP